MDKPYLFIAIGLALWAFALIIMRAIVPWVFDGGLIHVTFWVANFIVPVPAILLIAKATGTRKHQMLAPVTLIILPIMALDSVAITLDGMGKSFIYTTNSETAAATGGFLLFACASCLFWALIWHRTEA